MSYGIVSIIAMLSKIYKRGINSEKTKYLLEGIAGIGLAMISAVSDIEPIWDECLLLS